MARLCLFRRKTVDIHLGLKGGALLWAFMRCMKQAYHDFPRASIPWRLETFSLLVLFDLKKNMTDVLLGSQYEQTRSEREDTKGGDNRGCEGHLHCSCRISWDWISRGRQSKERWQKKRKLMSNHLHRPARIEGQGMGCKSCLKQKLSCARAGQTSSCTSCNSFG